MYLSYVRPQCTQHHPPPPRNTTIHYPLHTYIDTPLLPRFPLTRVDARTPPSVYILDGRGRRREGDESERERPPRQKRRCDGGKKKKKKKKKKTMTARVNEA